MTRSKPTRSLTPPGAKSGLEARPWVAAAVGLAAGCMISLVALLPARLAVEPVRSVTQGRVNLQEVNGTIWRGSAVVVLRGGSDSADSARLPGRVDWVVRLGLTGAGVALNADCCTREPWAIRVSPSWGGVDVGMRIPASTIPAQLLAGLGTPWNTLGLQAQLDLRSESLSLGVRQGRLAMTGAAQLDVVHAHSRLSTLKPVGSYRLVLSGGDVPSVKLSTLEGALQLSGDGQWIGQRLRFSGVASAQPEQEAVLQNLLNIIGRRQGARSLISIG